MMVNHLVYLVLLNLLAKGVAVIDVGNILQHALNLLREFQICSREGDGNLM